MQGEYSLEKLYEINELRNIILTEEPELGLPRQDYLTYNTQQINEVTNKENNEVINKENKLNKNISNIIKSIIITKITYKNYNIVIPCLYPGIILLVVIIVLTILKKNNVF